MCLAGCAGRTAPPDTRLFTDDLGRTVALPPALTRIVTVAPNLTEMVYAAGGGTRLVGVTTADNFPPAVDTLPHVGALPLDHEAVAALRPDAVLATTQINNPRDADTFAALGIPMVFLSFHGLDDVRRGIRILGDLLETRDVADRAAAALAEAEARLRRRTDTLAHRPTVLFLIGDETLFSFGPQSYIHTLIERAGGRSLTTDLTTENPILSDEYVLTRKPDVIVGTFGEGYDPARLTALHPTWRVVPAVRDGRIYSFDPDLFLRPGPRLLVGARRLAERLHPHLFRDPDGGVSP